MNVLKILTVTIISSLLVFFGFRFQSNILLALGLSINYIILFYYRWAFDNFKDILGHFAYQEVKRNVSAYFYSKGDKNFVLYDGKGITITYAKMISCTINSFKHLELEKAPKNMSMDNSLKNYIFKSLWVLRIEILLSLATSVYTYIQYSTIYIFLLPILIFLINVFSFQRVFELEKIYTSSQRLNKNKDLIKDTLAYITSKVLEKEGLTVEYTLLNLGNIVFYYKEEPDIHYMVSLDSRFAILNILLMELRKEQLKREEEQLTKCPVKEV